MAQQEHRSWPTWLVRGGRSAVPDARRISHLALPGCLVTLLLMLPPSLAASVGEGAIRSLARLDPARALPILQTHARSLRAHLRVLALSLLYARAPSAGHPEQEPLRRSLVAIAALVRAAALDSGGAAGGLDPGRHLERMGPRAAAAIAGTLREGLARSPSPPSASSGLSLPDQLRRVMPDFVQRRERIAERVLALVDAWARRRKALSRRLWTILSTWPCRTVDERVLARLEDADADVVAAALERRSRLRAAGRDRLHRLARRRGWLAGIATALLGERGPARLLVASADTAAVRAYIAAMRFAGEAIDVPVLRDPSTGVIQPVSGDFSPFRATRWRMFQRRATMAVMSGDPWGTRLIYTAGRAHASLRAGHGLPPHS